MRAIIDTHRGVTDAYGAIHASTDHYPFGMLMPDRSPQVLSDERTRYQFTGHEYDAETNYGYHGARYYNRELGKYMSIDPLAEQFFGWSAYNYTMNNPVMMIDPDGKAPTDDLVFDQDGNFVSGRKRGKFFEFLFGSRGSIVDNEGNTIREFKFNDRRDGQISLFDGSKVNGFDGLDLSFESKVEDVTNNAVEDAPTGGILNKEARKWIINESSASTTDEDLSKVQSLKLDFMTHQEDWFPQDMSNPIYLVGDRALNDFDAGNFLWGRSVMKIGLGQFFARGGAHLNAFLHGKEQYYWDEDGEPVEYKSKYTWTGDSRADQKAIKYGYKYDSEEQ